jgi:HTH-like domain
MYPIAMMCDVLGVSPAGYYAWCRRSPSRHAQRDQQLRVLVRASFTASKGRYGSPRIHRDLREDHQARARRQLLLPVSDNYFCRSRGPQREPRWRPQRDSVTCRGPVAAVRFVLSDHRPDAGGGRSWKTVRGFPRTGGRVLGVHGSGSVHGLRGAREGASRQKHGDPQVVRPGDRRSWGILSGRFPHDVASGRLDVPLPRRFACSVRKLGTSNSSSAEWCTRRSIAAAVAI